MDVGKSMSTGRPDPFDLQRFVDAQERIYDTVIGELTAGRKRSHWMWFVFPQLRGLGSSPTAVRFGDLVARRGPRIPGARAARAPAAGVRAGWSSQIDGRSAEEIFGWPDDLKLRSSMTLFARAADDNADFVAVLEKFYGGEEDPATLARLS